MPKLGKRSRSSKSTWDGRKKSKLDKENIPPSASSREKKRLNQWSDESMIKAMDAVKSGQLGVNRAAEQFGVPKTTLKDRLSGRVEHGSKSGPAPYLTKHEEKELVDFLVHMAKIEFWKDQTRCDLYCKP